MWNVIGQDKVVSSLKRSLSEGRLSHAYLMVGPPHVGKTTLAISLAQSLNCSATEERPCSRCSACRRIASGNHPDVHVIRRTDSGEGGDATQRKDIRIEQIRELTHAVNLKPFEGGHRVIIVDEAEFMNDEAANALLKTLEEPPESTVFVLIASVEDSLLPTIISRCQRLDLPPVPIPVIREALVNRWKLPADKADLLARLSHGAIGWAISAVDDAKLIEERSRHLEEFLSLDDADIVQRFKLAEELATLFGKNRSLARGRLELWLSWWRDVLLAKAGCASFITNADRQETLERRADQYSFGSIHKVISSIQETMRHLEQNANSRLALEVLMLNTSIEREISHA